MVSDGEIERSCQLLLELQCAVRANRPWSVETCRALQRFGDEVRVKMAKVMREKCSALYVEVCEMVRCVVDEEVEQM